MDKKKGLLPIIKIVVDILVYVYACVCFFSFFDFFEDFKKNEVYSYAAKALGSITVEGVEVEVKEEVLADLEKTWGTYSYQFYDDIMVEDTGLGKISYYYKIKDDKIYAYDILTNSILMKEFQISNHYVIYSYDYGKYGLPTMFVHFERKNSPFTAFVKPFQTLFSK